MNREVLRERVTAELERAGEALKAAESLCQDGLFSDSISRAYYAMFHPARAVLLTKGIEPETHRGIIQMFGLHFVKEGIFEARFGKMLNEACDDRELGDYIVMKKFTQEEVAERIADARSFLEQMRDYLKEYV